MLAMLGIMALPAMAQSGDYNDDYGDRYAGYGDDDYGDAGYNDDDYDRYPPGYDDQEEEPRAPDCDWYGPYHERPYDPWYEYWCYWHGWGWEYVFWVYA